MEHTTVYSLLTCPSCCLAPAGEPRSKSQAYRVGRWRVALISAWLALLLLLAARTVRRNQDWESDEALYRSGVTVNPPKGECSTPTVPTGIHFQTYIHIL